LVKKRRGEDKVKGEKYKEKKRGEKGKKKEREKKIRRGERINAGKKEKDQKGILLFVEQYFYFWQTFKNSYRKKKLLT
jgi:hypothetical protein